MSEGLRVVEKKTLRDGGVAATQAGQRGSKGEAQSSACSASCLSSCDV